jgi:hypothetical protein
MKDTRTREPSIAELTNEQLNDRITAAKNDGDVIEEIAELKKRSGLVDRDEAV